MHIERNPLTRTLLAAAVAAAAPVHAQPQIEEVIVTAQKREQTLQDVPGSVAALTSENFEKTITNNFDDLNKITAGINIQGGADGFGQVIRIRGVGTNSFVPAIRPAVGIFLNEIPLGTPEMAYNNLADIERIEFLKGPQATLFGKEVSSGAISMHTRRPNTEEIDGYIEGNFGNLDLIEVRGGGNIPINGSLAARASAYYNERGKTVDNVTVPGEPGGEYDQTGFRVHVLWAPNDVFSATLGYEDHQTSVYGSTAITQQYGDLYRTVDSLNPDGPIIEVRDPFDRETDNSDPADREADIGMWSLHLKWDIDERWSLNSITSDQEFEAETIGTVNEDGTSDTSVGPYRLNDFINAPSTDTFTQELRLSFDGANWSSIIGTFYADTDTISYTPFSNIVGIFAGGALRIKAAGLSDITDDFEEWAIFTHNIYSITEDFDITFGARYSEIEKESRKGQPTGIGPLAHLNSPLVPVNTWGNAIPVQKDTWDDVTGTLKLSYSLNPDVSVYGGWDRGFKAGGHNVCKNLPGGDEAVCPEPFESETADNFEVGMKGRFFDRRVSWNLAAFYQTYDDYQVDIADEVGIGLSVQNAAEAEISGVESEFVWLASENLSIDGNIAYIDASWESYEDAGCLRPQYQREACTESLDENGNTVFVQDLSGEPLNYTPKWSYNFNATWSDVLANGMSWYIRAEIAYRDEVNFFPDGDPDTVGDDYTLLNASFSLSSATDNWDIVLWGKNLADEEYLTEGARNRDQTQSNVNSLTNVEGYRVTVGEERTYGMTLRYRF